MNIEDLIKEPEGTTLEFKENINSTSSIIATIIAFANTSGGRIIIGVTDKTRHIVGINDPQLIVEKLSNTIHDIVEPRILPNIEVHAYRNTYLVSIEIYPSSLRPHFKKSKGKLESTYIRIGSTTRLADDALIKVIERPTLPKTFDEELCYEINCEEIDFTVVSQFFGYPQALQMNDLLSLGMLGKNGVAFVPTIGGILLAGKNRLRYFPDAWIQIGVFEGIDKEKILSTQDITSFFPYAADDVLNFIKKNIRIGLEIKDIRHSELWEIPKIALREAIINAVVHTDYSLKGAPIRISIFDDRIEIENSALLPWGLTFDELKTGISKLRNPVIGRVFKELGLIEQWGSGIKRMINTCKEAGLDAPDFKEVGPRIRVTFYKRKIEKPQLDEISQTILRLLSFYDSLSTHQIASFFDVTKRTIINRLTSLINKGQIIEISHGANDPKKKYTLAERENKWTIDDSMCKWQNTRGEPDIAIRVKYDNQEIDFLVSKSLVDDLFPKIDNRNEQLKKTKLYLIDKRILDIQLRKALEGFKIKESLIKNRYAEHRINYEDFKISM